MIIDEKTAMQIPPPPPYASANVVPINTAPPPFPHTRAKPTLLSLPPHILLQIIYMTFPQTHGIDSGKLERQRRTLYWLSDSLRLVSRTLYVACMHVLRSAYLPAYQSLIRVPYSSDPFPVVAQSAFPSTTGATDIHLSTGHRETTILDLFIALKVREDVWADETELYLERDESFRDLFDLSQPRSRLEDLVNLYGVREGVVCGDGCCTPVTPSSPSSSPTTGMFRPASTPVTRPISGIVRARSKKPAPVPFSALSVSFSTRKVGLQLESAGKSKRTILDIARSRNERLEVAAQHLVRGLAEWLQQR
ncbi:unnamed protein product [Mycena citricolor]|uniref:Uncharacterized protein n=1 Tax=Mycena citricolor TaxID=2018698 RepID=A0AAD2HNK7_9AGAR|nr:unnamed protein product [Mycena citricolor]